MGDELFAKAWARFVEMSAEPNRWKPWTELSDFERTAFIAGFEQASQAERADLLDYDGRWRSAEALSVRLKTDLDDLVRAVRAYIDSDDEDRDAEFTAMELALNVHPNVRNLPTTG